MTQHEYVFISISIILGLSITRLLSAGAALIRAHSRVSFHWSTCLWAVCVMLFILQLWWVGWELRTVDEWSIVDFFVLVLGSIFIYGSADLALPTEDYDISDDSELDFLAHSQSLGRVSALSMLGYFCIGPYVNIILFENPVLLSLIFPILGGLLLMTMAIKPTWFRATSLLFAFYTVLILYLTA